MSPVDKLATVALLLALVLFTAAFLLREHRLELEEARRSLDRGIVDDAYMDALDAAVDEVAARRALRPYTGDVADVVPLHPRKKDPAA